MYWEGRNNDHNKFHITKFFLASFLLVLGLSVQNVRPEDFTNGSDAATLANNCQLDNVFQSLLTPEELGSIQVRALRRELLKILNSQAVQASIDLPDYDLLSDGKLLYDESALEDKRSIASLAKSGQFPYENKRKLSSIARSGYRFGYPNKKSIANLAKNGQLPTLQAPEEEESGEEDKRSVASLARSGAMNRYFKRGIESLVRSGYMPGKRYNDYYENEDKRNVGSLARNGYMKREINDFLGDLYQKRYIGSLAKQYNFPSGKRNVGALARNGELYRFNRHNTDNSLDSDKRNVQSLMRNNAFYAGKRNIASVARNQNSPLYSRYEEYKRNIGAMARDWALPKHSTSWDHQEDEKRNVAALLRQDSYLHSVNRNSAVDAHPTPELGEEHQSEDKRNLASLKAQATSGYYSNRNMKRSVPSNDGNEKIDYSEASKDHESKGRQKRQADDYFAVNSDEYPVPVMQNTNGFDYEDLVQALAERYPNNEKRFLGNIPLSRMADLGKISLMGQAATSNSPPTSPTYRRRQYLLSRTLPEETE